MIDFSGVVLRTCMGVFARPVQVRPKNGTDYTARGIFDNKAVEVLDESGTSHVTTSPQLGIRLSEWPRQPIKGDQIAISGPEILDWFGVSDVKSDGQGGATVFLHRLTGFEDE
ncbi:head-tail joining protein [Ancylobacter oerskovii]|uniref:Head-to-tail stopper n=1 Tax=Ancylobacter oerskovii TaxID=459519 RepID=A0ABW4Z2Q7_9HYPH|nr:hypothetical protein [Ancylobacter oerskovii]MBS7546242.1 hypothetical protein [Ancylobacter oerskovii]